MQLYWKKVKFPFAFHVKTYPLTSVTKSTPPCPNWAEKKTKSARWKFILVVHKYLVCMWTRLSATLFRPYLLIGQRFPCSFRLKLSSLIGQSFDRWLAVPASSVPIMVSPVKSDCTLNWPESYWIVSNNSHWFSVVRFSPFFNQECLSY